MMNKKFIWPEPYLIEYSVKPISIWIRLKLAWSCIFGENVRGLCSEAPDWAREKGK